MRPVAQAAARAAGHAGTEVSAAQVGGHSRGPGGRWAALRIRRPRPMPEPHEAKSGTSHEPDHVTPDHVAPDLGAPDLGAQDQVALDQVAPNRVAPNQVAQADRAAQHDPDCGDSA